MTEFTHQDPASLKWYNEVIDNDSGDVMRYYESGAIYNYTTKKLKHPGKGFSSETALAANQKRTAMAKEAMELAIAGEGNGDLVKGLYALSKQRVNVAMGEGHESNKAFELVMKTADLKPKEEKAGVTMTLNETTALKLLEMIGEIKEERLELQ